MTAEAEIRDLTPLQAAKAVERVTGNSWATDCLGWFTYQTPVKQSFGGFTLEELAERSDPIGFPLERTIHSEDLEGALEVWRRCLQTGEHFNVQYRKMRRDGQYAWVKNTGQLILDVEGVPLGWYGTETEVLPLDVSTDPTLSLGAPIAAEIHPHDRATVEQATARAFFHGTPQVSSYRQLQPDGNYRWATFHVEPDRSAKVAIKPATARQEDDWTTAESLGESAEAVRAAMVVENLYGGAWALDASGQFTYATPTAQTSIAMTLRDLNVLLDGRPFLEGGEQGWQRGTHPEDRELVGESLRQALRSGQHWNFEYRVHRADGAYVWHRAAARPTRDSQGRITGWYGATLDIDVYKRTEAALVERERLLQQLIDTVPALIWSANADGTLTYLNKPFMQVTGATLAAMTADDGLPSLIVIHPEDREAARDAYLGSISTGTPYFQRYRQIRRDGNYHWTETRAEPLRDEDGTILQWYGVSSDVHDLVTAQDTIQKRERFLWQLVAKLPAMIDCADAKGEPIFRSQQLQEFLGYDLDELEEGKSRLAATLDAAVHPDDLASVKELYARSLATGEPYLKKHRLRRFDGVYRWVETRAAPLRDSDGTIVQWNLICLDIDGEVRAQENLLKAQQRLASANQAARLAELSASIAHEVNQPLSAVINYSVACQRWLAADPPNFSRAQRSLERIIHSANSAVSVVGRIRALFKQATDQRDCTALTEVVHEVTNLLTEEDRLHGTRIAVTSDVNLRPVPFDRVQIQQVLFNLMRNGLDAMAGNANDKLLEILIQNTGGNIQVEIRDHGRGIVFPEKIFEPFFTTKEQGMGMGLAICRTIIEAHGGELWAEKNEPEGAKFIFTLPEER